MAKGKAKNRYASQINSETELRYGPQLSALASLLSNAQSDRNQALSVNASTAQAMGDAARLAQPEVDKANDSYLSQLLAAKGSLGNPDTAAYAASGDPYKEALARDLAGAQARAAETTRDASRELTQRGLDARAGAASGARAINDRYSGQAQQIGQQAQELTGQSGAFAASRLAELLGDDAKTAHDTSQAHADRQATSTNAANQNATTLAAAGVNPDGTVIPGGKADPAVKNKKIKWATPQQTGKAKDSIAAAKVAAEKMKAAGRSRAEIAKLLVGGRPSQSVQDPNTGAISTVPGVEKVPELFASVALDLVFDGHVSSHGGTTGHGNVGELHRRRYKVRDLGLPTRPRRATPTTRVTPGASSTGGLPVGPIGPVSVR